MPEATPTPEELAAQAEHDGPTPIIKDGVVYVGLKLAHPLSKEDAERCGALRKQAYNVGNTIRVRREWGLALIEGGRVQVDPTDRAAVQKALLLNGRNAPLTDEELTKLVGGSDADAAVPARTEAQQSAADAPADKPTKGK